MRVSQQNGTLCPVLVGREAELATLEQLLAQAGSGPGQAVVLEGEAGVGKSRLTAEVATLARAAGFTVLAAGCLEHDHALPYAGLLEPLRTLLAPGIRAHGVDALDPVVAPLVSLLPEYAALVPPPPVLVLEPQQERQRVIQAFVQLIAQRTHERPVLFVLEDLHWSDEATLAVFAALARRAPTFPVLVLGTYRQEELPPGSADAITTLIHKRLVLKLRLIRLSYEQADTMLRAIFRQQRPIRGDFLSALYTLTEGNPFFIEEVLTALVEAGDIFVANGRWERRVLVELHIPESIQAAIQRHARALSPSARQLADLAAAIGRRFDFVLLQHLTGLDEATVLAQIKELTAVQLVTEEHPDCFAFRHALTRAALSAGLLARERRALHRRIAAALEALAQEGGAASVEARAADLAHHFFAAGEWAAALRYARQAAAHAQRFYAPAAAAEHLTRAITAARELGLPPPSDLLRDRGHMHETLGAAEAALADYTHSLAAARAHNDRAEEWRTLLATGFFYAARDYAVMGSYLRQALDLARALDDPLLLGQSLNRYGNWHMVIEQPGEALRLHHEALAIFEASGDRQGLAETYDLLGVTALMGRDKRAAAAHYQRAITLFRELDDLAGLASALATVALRGVSYYHTTTAPVEDGYAAWIGDGEEALQLSQRMGWRAGEANALVYLSLVHGASGEYGRALACAQAARELAEEIEHPVWITGAALARGALLLDLLDPGAARVELEQALARAAELGTFFARRAAAYLALACIAQRDLDRAAAALAPLLDEATPLETQGQRLDWLARAELALAQGEPVLAAGIARGLLDTAAPGNATSADSVPVLWLLYGEALAASGDSVAAEEALRTAMEGATRLGLLPTLWRVQRSLGRLYHARGRRSLARDMYAQARATIDLLARRVPDATLRATFSRATSALLPRGTAVAAQGSQTALRQLTRREREVAALIAQGKTSREIAADLVLGERTVETHIGNILGKLGFSSRREIAAWALAAGLVQGSA